MIKYLIMDVDGTLTDGKVYIGNNGELFKAFNIKDGYGIAHVLKKKNIEPIVITGRVSEIVSFRCKELNISKVYQGRMDKIKALQEAIGSENFGSCAYMGDDVPDLKCMKLVKAAGGVVGCPADAIDSVKEISDYVSEKRAGDGAVRDYIEWLIDNKCD